MEKKMSGQLKSGPPTPPPEQENDDEDRRLAMKLQVEEGLLSAPGTTSAAAVAAAEAVSAAATDDIPAVASMPVATGLTGQQHQQQQQNRKGGGTADDDDDDSQVAWNLQVQENERAWDQQQQATATTAGEELQQEGNNNNNKNNQQHRLASLRMGAAPYQPPKSRDHLGSFSAANNYHHQQQLPNQIFMELPSSLQQSGSAATTGGSGGSSSNQASSSAEATSMATTTTAVKRHREIDMDWIDMSRPSDGDPVFLHLLGSYDNDKNDNTAAITHTKMKVDWKLPRFKIPRRLSSDVSTLGVIAGNACVVEMADGDDALLPTTSINMTEADMIKHCERLRISFRTVASRLPFCLRFQLERCLLMDVANLSENNYGSRNNLSSKNKSNNNNNKTSYHDNVISVRKRNAPFSPEKCARIQDETRILSRKMMIVFIQEVLPALLQVLPQLKSSSDNNASSSSVSLTCAQLFADELWESLRDVKKAIAKSDSIHHWFPNRVQSALGDAWATLRQAEKLCQCREADLDEFINNTGDNSNNNNSSHSEAYTQFIRKRSLWPMAEYRVQFTLDGRLLPKGYEVVNKTACKNASSSSSSSSWTFKEALKKAPAQSRRAIRELGWDVRDRLLVFSSIPFHEIHRDSLAQWCRNQPRVCGQRYEYLFDKGAGSPSVWFFSATDAVCRNDYLERLGAFAGVDKTKLGDRIGLAFTLTKPVVQLDITQIVAIPEITRNGYVFTDGCGVIGWDIAKRVTELSGNKSVVPGAIQIRLGGVKGMLSVRKDFPANCIGIRPSMIKFPSSHTFLEVKEAAKRIHNRETSLFYSALLIMKHLGAPPEAFMDLQRKAWAEIALKYDDDSAKPLLSEPIDYSRVSKYVQGVVNDGHKLNGEPFSLNSLSGIIGDMESSKKSSFRMNLNCSVTLMMGVADEHGILEEGQCLVGNGFKTGKVLLCRPPCNHPGDVQLAEAIPRQEGAIFGALDHTIVFSTKGDRPLADMLAGGDYDGDKYYVVDESLLVESIQPVQACDFESQRENIVSTISIESYFILPDHGTPIDLEEQIDVFHQYMGLGDIVSSSSEAWLRLADRNGPDHENSKRVASVCQKALDARKLACTFKALEMEVIDVVLSTTHPNRIDKPRWRGGPESNPSNSILGALFDKWEEKIGAIKAIRDHRRVQTPLDSLSPTDDDVTVASEITQDTRQFDAVAGNPALSGKTATEILVDITFGRNEELLTPIGPIDYRSITKKNLKVLINLVLWEYKEDLRGGRERANFAYIGKHPLRNYDVYLIKKEQQPQRTAICQPKLRTKRGMEWRVSDGVLPVDKINDRRYRVASIVGFARILESLMCNPIPPLMRSAMNRSDLVEVVAGKTNLTDTSTRGILNESQAAAVAAVQSRSFGSGILSIQGPPGTGKTSTIVQIILESKKSLVLAPSNAAVANIVTKLIESNINPENIVVWGRNCDEKIQYLNPILRNQEYARVKDDTEKERILREYAANLKVEAASLRDLLYICNDDDGKRSVAAATVILCTLNSAGSQSLRRAVRAAKEKPDLCVLDEAGQCTEAEFYVATTFPFIRRLVVCGDPAQLPATVVNSACEKAGLGISWLGNLFKLKPEKVHLLDTQYRMDRQILRISNSFFYGNRIISDESVMNRQPAVTAPFRFISTSEGVGREERLGTSWLNQYEAKVIRSLLRNDEDIKRILESQQDARVIVITPYKAQVELLETHLKNIKSTIDIGTVDKYQGQEGEIVVVSTVRTGNVAGFVDNANRMCVALTRGRKVLRVVGDFRFFKSLDIDDSILRNLAVFAEKNNLVDTASVDDIAWAPPTSQPESTSFKRTVVSRFHHCLQKMRWTQRNIALHTLHTVATPDIKKLKARPVESEAARWQTSALHNQDIYVTWIAKHYQRAESSVTDQSSYVGVIEAHYTGTKEDCNHFVQTHRVLPTYAATGIKGDLSMIKNPHTTEVVPARSSDTDLLSWTVTSDLEEAMVNDTISRLPEGLFALDGDQERVLLMKPPLLIESRSGTGKTNVLFQHAVAYAKQLAGDAERSVEDASDDDGARSILFVTVSSKLQEELRDRYIEYMGLSTRLLPKQITFFSLKDLLQYLLNQYSDSNWNVKSISTYMHYVYSRTSKKKLPVESSLIENEIGGVIKGSLNAAVQKRALNEEEYLAEKRSNIETTEEGTKTRLLVYADYVLYERWKKENEKFDISDVVLLLIKLQIPQELFLSAYLDEVQDFSYATLVLICSLAGRRLGQWTAAGDTAQMISPGCSFKFAGLKTTLNEVNSQIAVPKIVHLRRNYRMTKAVLEVANAVLNLAKIHFPTQIEFAKPEIPMKDFGFKVDLVKWSEARTRRVAFGTEQAIVYAGQENEGNLAHDLTDWTNGHPLIFSVLEAKGLEYDDVVVVFDKGNKSWNIATQMVDALRNSRELYVAITRARKRVVILVRNKPMRSYFETELECGLEMADASIVLKEFEKETSLEEWKREGLRYFSDRQYRLAESCFNRANQNAWSSFARGKHSLDSSGQRKEAKEAFRSAANAFYESTESTHCLDVVKELVELLPWSIQDNAMVEEALEAEPDHLPRQWVVKLAILVSAWQRISIADMQDAIIAKAFEEHQKVTQLKDIVRELPQDDRDAISRNLPILVGDIYMDEREFALAVRLFVAAQDIDSATKATLQAVEDAKQGRGDIAVVVESWNAAKQSTIKKDSRIKELLALFHNPAKASKSNASKIMKDLGPVIVRRAVDHANADVTVLHSFDPRVFGDEVHGILIERYIQNPIEVVRWYHTNDDRSRGADFAGSNLFHWTNTDLFSIMGEFTMRPDGLVNEIGRRDAFLDAAKVCLTRATLDLSLAEELSNKAIVSIDATVKNKDSLLSIWRPFLGDNLLQTKMRKQRDSGAKISKTLLLLYLFDNPKDAGRHFGKACMTYLGKDLVMEAVASVKGTMDADGRYQILRQFDTEAFEAVKPKQPPKQEAEIKSKRDKVAEKQMDKPKFQVEQRVKVIGLESKAARHLNGSAGTITKSRTTKGRYGVQVDGIKTAKEIKEGNLEPLLREDDNSSDDSDDSDPPPLISKSKVDSSDEEQEDNISDDNLSLEFDNEDDDGSDDSPSDPPPLLNSHNNDSSSGSDRDGGSDSSESSSMPNLEERDQKNSSSSSDNSSSSDSSDDGNMGRFMGHAAARGRAATATRQQYQAPPASISVGGQAPEVSRSGRKAKKRRARGKK